MGCKLTYSSFCEEDYAITRYLAEFINSLTNFAYGMYAHAWRRLSHSRHTHTAPVYLALRHMYGPGSRGLFAPNKDFMSISLLILGIVSFLFHATMRETMEFADELGMLGLGWSLLQGLLIVRQSPARVRIINIGLAVFFPAFSVFYVLNGNIIYHSRVFVSVLLLLVGRGAYLFYWVKPGFSTTKRNKWRADGRWALGSLLVGYILWEFELQYCAELRSLRERVGLPWAWLLEFHGWWHILTAIAASGLTDIVREIQEELAVEKKE